MPLPRRTIFDFTPPQIEAIRARILPHLHPIPFTGCTVWGGGRSTDGNDYSKVSLYGSLFFVHRVVFELMTGAPIPPGLLLDHGCRWHPCCDHEHLEPVTTKVNTHRGRAVLFKSAA